MYPKLIGLHGPLKDSEFPLRDESVSIGRHDENVLRISDRRVSRHHCEISREEEEFRLSDLGSAHGTFVNGVPIQDQVLAHGDQIRVASSVFWFLLHEEDSPAAVPVELDQRELTSQTTTMLPGGSSRYLTGEAVQEGEGASDTLARSLSALLKLSTEINSVRESEPLQRKLLEFIREVIPAHRCVFLTRDNEGDGYSPSLAWDHSAKTDHPVQVSRTIVDRVVADELAILSQHVPQDKDLNEAQSLMASGVQSVLCVPLMAMDRLLGVIYLETSDPAEPFQEDHLHLLTAMAGIGGVALQNAHYLEWLENENLRLQEDLAIEHDMVGKSPAMQGVYDLIAKVAPAEASVLIVGENGTGKELAARAIHQNSARSDKPFVAINCAALVDSLLESELFGHEKGAFTSANAQARGKLEVAQGGTVFLDEIVELALSLQAKLLRVLEEREFDRVGGTRPVKVDIRLVAATNKDLEKEIEKGSFRRDLFFRLNVVCLSMPPLREHREDIPQLAQYFASKFSEACKRTVSGISPKARACLTSYAWPGNVRELRNAIERAVVLGSSDIIRPEDLPESVIDSQPGSGDVENFHEAVKQRKKELILKAVKDCNNVLTEAAQRLGLHPNYLHRLIRNLDLRGELE